MAGFGSLMPSDVGALMPEAYGADSTGDILGGLAQGPLQHVMTPGAVMKPNPYPPGSEQAGYYEMMRSKAEMDFANQRGMAALMPMPAVQAAKGAIFGSGAIRRARMPSVVGGRAPEEVPALPRSGTPAAETPLSEAAGPSGQLFDPLSPEERFKTAPGQGAMPQLAERYPETVPPILTYKKTGEVVPAKKIPVGAELERRLDLPKKDPQAVFNAKETSPEAAQLTKVRKQMKPDIESGNYPPYFDPAERADVDPGPYGPYHDTSQNLMKKAKTREQYDALAANPGAIDRLNEAYARGLKQKDAAGNWYFMKQLQDEFVKEYGEVEGRAKFKERFADSMAATTGGADPTGNLLMAHYGNFLKAQGLPVPEFASVSLSDRRAVCRGKYGSVPQDDHGGRRPQSAWQREALQLFRQLPRAGSGIDHRQADVRPV